MIFKQVFRVAFVALIWKQYKAVIISTLLLLAFLFLVGSIHRDYIAAVNHDTNKSLSFIYKWCAYSIGFVVYFFFHWIRNRFKTPAANNKEKIAESKALDKTDDDPFASIRSRKTLRSRADFIAEENIAEKNKP